MNLLAATDDRFDTSGIAGGTFYNTKQQMLDLVGSQPVSWVGLIADSGWQSDQVLNLSTASVNGGTAFVFPAPVNSSFQTNGPIAKIAVQKYNDDAPDGPVDEVLSSAQGDTSGLYRQVDGKYIYNLDTASFNPAQQPGDYKVFLKIDDTIVGQASSPSSKKARGGPRRGSGLRRPDPRRKRPGPRHPNGHRGVPGRPDRPPVPWSTATGSCDQPEAACLASDSPSDGLDHPDDHRCILVLRSSNSVCS